MEPKHILWVTVYPAHDGGGYATITTPLAKALVEQGHDVKIVAMDNHGEEHTNNFSVLPTRDISEAQISIHNLKQMWGIDLIVAALDLPLHEILLADPNLRKINDKLIPYVAITPMENGPLIKSVAMSLSQADKVMFISQYAVSEAAKVGLESVFLPVAVDVDFWQPVSDDRKAAIKKTMGYDPSEIVFLTVAENQERKNLAAGLKAVSIFKQKYPEVKFRYVMVSTEYNQYTHHMGNRLTELAQDLGLADEFILFGKGMPRPQLRLLYQMSDTFILPSKAEGLGLPVLEAMACNLQVVATRTGAIPELLEYGRGFLVDPIYSFIDVWMNSQRDMINVYEAADYLYKSITEKRSGGREYTESLVGQGPSLIKTIVEEVCQK